MEARLVILGPEYPYAKNDGVRAVEAAENILNTRGNAQRIYRNALVFLAPDKQRLPELRQAVRLWMAWSSIADEHEQLNLDAFQRKQAESKRGEFEKTVAARILETWVWALVPHQSDPKGRKIEWSPSRLQGQDALATRCSKKLVQEESLLTKMGPARLKLVLDNYLWQNADHIGTKKLSEYLASYLYLPRLRDIHVLMEAIQAGIGELVCDNLAYAGRFDEERGRYEGLKLTGGGSVVIDSLSVLVKPDVAKAQQATDTADRPRRKLRYRRRNGRGSRKRCCNNVGRRRPHERRSDKGRQTVFRDGGNRCRPRRARYGPACGRDSSTSDDAAEQQGPRHR